MAAIGTVWGLGTWTAGVWASGTWGVGSTLLVLRRA
jgi:hypothetical protein